MGGTGKKEVPQLRDQESVIQSQALCTHSMNQDTGENVLVLCPFHITQICLKVLQNSMETSIL